MLQGVCNVFRRISNGIYIRISIRILKGFKVILKDIYKVSQGISKGIQWRFNGILKDF